MRIWTANLGRGVTALFERNLDRLLEAAGKGSIICLQEIDEADKPDELGILLEKTRFTHDVYAPYTGVPIVVPQWMRVEQAAVTPACRGLAEFTPNRFVNEVVVRLVGSGEVAVLNTHLPIDRPETATRRTEVRRALRQRANEHEQGVWCADTNTHEGWPRIHPLEVSLIDAGIDKAKAWGPVDVRLVTRPLISVNLTIDKHDAHGATVVWYEAA